MKLHWSGHSNCMLSDGSANILIDPFFTGNPSCTTDWHSLPTPDAVLVTHDHGDHVGDAIEICKQTNAPLICVVGTGAALARAGAPEKCLIGGGGMNIGGSVKVKGTTITMTQAFHSSDSGVPTGFIITMPSGFRVYHAGDTGIFSDMAVLGNLYPLDLALLPIGGFYTMDAYQAAHACRMLFPKAVLPIHWGTFPMLAQDTEEFATLLPQNAQDCKFIDLQPNKSYTFG